MYKRQRRDDALKLVTVPRGFTGHCVASFHDHCNRYFGGVQARKEATQWPVNPQGTVTSSRSVSYTHLSLEICYNLKAAACAAARVQGTRPCAGAQGFENIEPCKTAGGAVLLRLLHGGMV